MKLDVKELWGKAWSLRPGQNTANMKYVGKTYDQLRTEVIQ